MSKLKHTKEIKSRVSEKVKCQSCGVMFFDTTKNHRAKFCSVTCKNRECRRRAVARKKGVDPSEVVFGTVKKKEKPQPNMDSIKEISRLAKEKGLSYGMYILMYGKENK